LPILNSLHKNFELVLCVTKEDKKVGRKQVLTETAVKTWAKKQKIDLITLVKLKNKEIEELIKSLKEHNIELGIVADFSFIVPQNVLQTPKHGLINIHFSLLPKLRGASPVQHAILQGLPETGVTFYLMDEYMDTGDIIKQASYKLKGDETAGSLYQSLFKVAAEQLPQVINSYVKDEVEPQAQDESKATYCWSPSHPKTTYIFKEDAKIDWQKSSQEIERMIRAFQPWPVAWTYLNELENNEKLSQEFSLKDHVDKNLTIKIHQAIIADKTLQPKKVQVSGKNVIDWKSFLNGYVE
jgi:methionyl-tRNA formyltransferase